MKLLLKDGAAWEFKSHSVVLHPWNGEAKEAGISRKASRRHWTKLRREGWLTYDEVRENFDKHCD